MAIDFSPAYVKASQKKLRYSPLWWQMRFWRIIKKWRMFRRRFASKRIYSGSAPCFLTESLEKSAAHFQTHTWAFFEDILSPDFHDELCKNWPKKYFLEPPREKEKSYNIGFGWHYGKEPNFKYYDPYGQYPLIVTFLNYMRSDEVARRVERLTGSKGELVCYSCILTDAGPGAEVIPHVDSIQDDTRAGDFVNMVFFIDATGGKHSGALALSKDNELRDIIFEPPRLRNTMLMYNSLANYYHGVAPIVKGKFRWTIGIQFCAKTFTDTK